MTTIKELKEDLKFVNNISWTALILVVITIFFVAWNCYDIKDIEERLEQVPHKVCWNESSYEILKIDVTDLDGNYLRTENKDVTVTEEVCEWI